MWTLHDIEVIIHLYCKTRPWPRGRTPAYATSIDKLYQRGLIDAEDHLTPKGCAFIEMLRNTPEPVEGFVDPRVTESLGDAA